MLIQLAPRLLKKTDAARYCGLDPTSFRRECPVRPVKLGDKTFRYDVRALDKWLDALSGGPELTGDQWLGKLDDDDCESERR